MQEELKTTLDNGLTLWVKPQFILGVEPSKLKAGDIIAAHKSSRHSEHLRLIIVDNDMNHGKFTEDGISRFQSVILFTIRPDYIPGQTYVFWSDSMAHENWRIV